MDLFSHYMYVLECEGKNLYCGYATDVAARFVAHASGRGAKYTKSHPPLRIVGQARFYSKERAMSAEALFKRLSRAKKDELLAKAAEMPLEDVLRTELPGFAEDTAGEFVCRSLAENVDPVYREFHARLVPTVDPRTIAGVRTPVLRKIARDLARRDDAATFLRTLPHRLFDENQVHAFAIGFERDYGAALALYDEFLPFVDNWATCDQLPVKILAACPDKTLEKVGEWVASGHCYMIRFGMGVLMRLFLDELFEPRFLDLVAQTRMPLDDGSPASDDDIYYVDMMRAWYFAEALVRQEQAALPYFELTGKDALLDEWTRRKGIQKAIESLRVSPDMKAHLRALR